MVFRTVSKEIRGEKEYLNITQIVVDEIKKSKVWEGQITIQTLHTTTALFSRSHALLLQEDEPCFIEDLLERLEKMFPKDDYYRHDDFKIRTVNYGPEERKNAASHLKASLFPSSLTLLIKDGELVKGTWQSILFFDFDPEGREARNIIIQVIGKRKRKNHNNKRS